MLSHLVTGRYAQVPEGQSYAATAVRPNWLRRAIAAIFGKKS